MRFLYFNLIMFLCFSSNAQTFQQRLNPLRLSPGVSNVSLTSDKGFLYSSSYNASITVNPGGMNLTKLSRNASIQWSKDYTLNESPLNGSTVKWEAQNGYLITSFLLDTLQNKHVALLDTLGNVVWSKRFGANNDINSVNTNSGICLAKVIDDTSFALAGGTGLLANNNGNNDLFLGKINNSGNIIWSKQICFGCIGNDVDASLQSFIITNDGGFLLCGYINNYSVFPFANGVLLTKLDAQGNLEWSKTYRNTFSFGQSIGYDVKQKPNGNYIVVGQNNDFVLNEGLLLEVTSTGTLLNSHHVNITNESHYETIQKLELENNGDLVFAMSTYRDTNNAFSYEWNILAKLDALYNLKWANNYEEEPLPGFGPTRFCDMKKSYDNGYAYLLNTAPTTAFTDFYPMLVETDIDGKTGCETPIQLNVVANNNYAESINLPTIIPITQQIPIQLNVSNFNGLLINNQTIQLGNDTTVCSDIISIPLSVNNIPNTTYKWNTSETSNSITATSPGVYWVENYNPSNCLKQSDTIVIAKSSNFMVQFKLNDSVFCKGNTYPLSFESNQPNLNIEWSNGQTSNSINIDTTGTYFLIAKNDSGCSVKIDTTITFNETPLISILGDDSICAPNSITLSASASYPYYQWNNGQFTNSININQAGNYSLFVKDQFGCTNSATKNISPSSSCIDLFIPTAFSPNKDGINDVFRTKGVSREQFYTYYLQVFNRWGQLVFLSSNPDESWDGNYKGRPCEPGSYYWSLYYKLPNTEYKIIKGDINLIR
jgi:gliding motility-associated-like protein